MADFDKSKFDPKAAAEARKAEMDEITTKLEKGVKDIFTSDGYKDYLNLCAKLPRYSVNNQILIMLQRPDATMCQSFTGWKDMNRFVRKGEKGIRILAPSPYKMQKEQDKTDPSGKPILDKDGEPVKETVEITVNAFKPVSTFDVSQTEGDPIPTLGTTELTGTVEGYNALFDAIKEVVPVPITFEDIPSGAKGYFHLEENRIAIQEGMSEAQTVKTAIHEAAHQALHSKDDSFAYVATWSADKEVPELKASLDTIRKTASDMIVKIDEKLQARDSVKEVEEFIAAHGDELPFDNPEAGQPIGFIKIEPPVDFGSYQTDKKIEITMEQPEAEKPEKAQEEKSAKKTSVKEKLKAEKAKSQKTKSPKKDPKKDLQEAI